VTLPSAEVRDLLILQRNFSACITVYSGGGNHPDTTRPYRNKITLKSRGFIPGFSPKEQDCNQKPIDFNQFNYL